MSNYKRITERSGNGICIKETSTNDNKSIWNAIERLAELEDKIENGTLRELPCKVNDTCYFVTQLEEDFDLCCGYVKAISIDKDGIWLACVYDNGLSYWHKSNDKRLFFNSYEAEAKLRALNEKPNFTNHTSDPNWN